MSPTVQNQEAGPPREGQASPEITLGQRLYFVTELAVRVLGLWAAVWYSSNYFKGVERKHYLLATAIYLPVTIIAMQDTERPHWVFGKTQIDINRIVTDCAIHLLFGNIALRYNFYLCDQSLIPRGSKGDIEGPVMQGVMKVAKESDRAVIDIFLILLMGAHDNLLPTSLLAFNEEFVYRGVLQEFFENVRYLLDKHVTHLSPTTQKNVANVAQALLFGMAHIAEDAPPVWQLSRMFFTGIGGLHCGFIRNRDESIYSPCIVHTISNIFARYSLILNVFVRYIHREYAAK